MATQLATRYTEDAQTLLTAKTGAATLQAAGISKLSSALSAFDSSLLAISAKKSVLSNSATFSAEVGTATAGPTAVAGNYNFYVEQLATAGQVAYGGLSDSAAAGSGSLNVVLADGTNFNVNLVNADKNLDGTLSAQEVATAINLAADNDSSVTASTLTVNGATTLVLTSNATGAANSASLDTSGVTNLALKAMFDDVSQRKQLVAAQDAVVWVGAQGTGTKMQQASNTFAVVDDVKMTFTKAQAVGAAPVSLTVKPDTSGTQANVQAFVDAYNKLNAVLDELTYVGDTANKKAPGAFANDAGLNALRLRMQGMLRQPVNGTSLPVYGIVAKRDGTLELDSKQLAKSVALNPDGLDKIFGTGNLGNASALLGGLDKLLGTWTSSVNGQIGQRRTSNDRLQKSLGDRQVTLDGQFNNAYKRYAAQFTTLQKLQGQMSQNTGIFDALFGNNKDS
jgi:flagellar hook-associated protein 2